MRTISLHGHTATNDNISEALRDLLENNDISHFSIQPCGNYCKCKPCQCEPVKIDFNDLGQVLRENTGLTHLTLMNCPLSAADLTLLAEAMAKNTTLTHLTINNCNLQATDLQNLFDQGLAKNRHLEYLDVAHNQITDVLGVKMAQFASAMGVEVLDMHHSGITVHALPSLKKIFKESASLSKIVLNPHQSLEKTSSFLIYSTPTVYDYYHLQRVVQPTGRAPATRDECTLL